MPTALITGGSRGLGRALSVALAERGWELVIDGRETEALARIEAELEATTGRIHAVPGDVSDAEHRSALAAAVSSIGGLDLLVNNASILGPSPQPRLADYPLEELRRVYEVNTLAPLALAQLLLPALRRSRGTVIDITSDAASEAYEGWGGYGSAKAALDQLSAVLAAEEPDLRIYAFDPGDMRTRMQQEAFPGDDISDRPEPHTVVPALLQLLAASPPSGRYRAADLALA